MGLKMSLLGTVVNSTLSQITGWCGKKQFMAENRRVSWMAHPERAESQEKLPYAKQVILVWARERAWDPSAFSMSSSGMGRCRSDEQRLVT